LKTGVLQKSENAPKSNLPKGVKIIDAKGKTLLPGLFDTHQHATQAEWFPAMLAAGVTTMRDAANELEFIVPVRNAINAGKIPLARA
jgi:imidazolonepropionase-like amidohydrolase